ncbi:MAG TPA: fumarylacetoacetate hydrolase family protein [Rectinemataceae bacterium]
MALSQKHIQEAADALDAASRSCQATEKLTLRYPGIDVDDAYAIQMLNVRRALDRGGVISGKKIGLTSKAMQDMFGVTTPDFGHLFADMEVSEGRIERSSMVQPKVEAEIAFVLARDLDMVREITAADVLAATDYVVAALEIVDSRIGNWKIGYCDTVSDNASSGRYVLGSIRKKVSEIDLKAETMDFFVNGEKRNSGKGTDVLGDPAYCVAWLANSMRKYGTLLKKGEVILSGALSAAISASAGDTFRADYSSLGHVSVAFY